MMKRYILFGLVIVTAVACRKNCIDPPVDPPKHPPMLVKDFRDSTIAFGRIASIDLNDDGEKDVLFSTQLVGDPVEQKDKRQWMVTSSFNANLPVNTTEHIPVLRHTDSIPVNNFSDYAWFNASHILLSQKTITMTTTYWEGDWKQASHNFVPIQLMRQGSLYNGWIEISFSTENERLTIHKTAVCKKKDTTISAGVY